MARHVAILGFIYGIFGVLAALAGVTVMLFGWGAGLVVWLGGHHDAGAAGALAAAAGSGLGLLLLFGGLLNGLTAVGLWGRRRWGRILGIVASILNILPLSWMSLFGVYGLWVLFSEEGKREFAAAR